MNPECIFGFLHRQLGTVELHILNVAGRVVFGVLLISQSGTSRFPLVIETIGWFCIAIAIILTLMGRAKFNRLISWAVSLVEAYSRVGGVVIITFGAFLMSAFV
jgi:uncharacterized membrane protein YidH (DUF202 family)